MKPESDRGESRSGNRRKSAEQSLASFYSTAGAHHGPIAFGGKQLRRHGVLEALLNGEGATSIEESHVWGAIVWKPRLRSWEVGFCASSDEPS